MAKNRNMSDDYVVARAQPLRRLIDRYVESCNLAMAGFLRGDKTRTKELEQAREMARVALSTYINNLADRMDGVTKFLSGE